MYWAKIETDKPSRWHTPHAATTSESTPVLEGIDKLKKQLGMNTVVDTDTGSAAVIFSYTRGGDNVSDDEEEENKGSAVREPHPQIASEHTNSYAASAAIVQRSGTRPVEHTSRLGTITVVVGAEGSEAANALQRTQSTVSAVLTQVFAAAAHATLTGVTTNSPSKSASNFVRNAPTPPSSNNLPPTNIALCSARRAALESLVLDNPLGPLGLLSRLLYEAHVRTSVAAPIDQSAPTDGGKAVGSVTIDAPTMASARALDILKAVQHNHHTDVKSSYSSALFTQFLLDAITGSMSRPHKGETFRALPIPPFLQSTFSLCSSSTHSTCLLELSASALRSLLFNQLQGRKKTQLTIAIQGTLAEDDGLSLYSQEKAAAGSSYPSAFDADLHNSVIAIHPLLFCCPALPVFPCAPCPVETAAKAKMGLDLPHEQAAAPLMAKAKRLLVDNDGKKPRTSVMSPSIGQAGANDLVWSLLTARHVLATAGSQSQDIEVRALSARLGESLASLAPSAVFAAQADAPHAQSFQPGQSSATMALHYLRLTLKAIFSHFASSSTDAASSDDDDSDSSSDMSGGSSDSDDDEGGCTYRASADDALMGVCCGGCRFITLFHYTAVKGRSEPTDVTLQGGLCAIAGKHFYHSQLSHYDRLLQSVMARNMALVQNQLNMGNHPPEGGSVPSKKDTPPTWHGTELDSLLIQIAAIEARARQSETVCTGGGAQGSSGNSTTLTPSLQSRLSAYVVRNFATDHPCHPKIDLLVMGMAGGLVAVLGFASSKGAEPNAATMAMDGLMRGMGNIDASDFGGVSLQVDPDYVSDSSSDDDLTVEEVRSCRNPCGGSRFHLQGTVMATVDDAANTKKGLCNDCCGAKDGEESVGFAYGHEPSVLAIGRQLQATDQASSFRRHGLVKRRRTHLLALTEKELGAFEAQDKKHRKSEGAKTGSTRYIVDYANQWSPLTLASRGPTTCSPKYGLRSKAKAFAELLTYEGKGSLNGRAAGSAPQAARQLASQWDREGHQQVLRRSVALEQAAARRELAALRARIERIEHSGGLMRARVVPVQAGTQVGNPKPSAAAVRDEALRRLHDKVARREKFLALLVQAKPWGPTKVAQPSATRSAGDEAATAMVPATPADMLQEVLRYARKCDRAANLFYSNGQEVVGSLQLSLVTATDRLTRNAYSSTIGPIIKPLILAASNGSRSGTMGGLPVGSAIDLAERCLVGSAPVPNQISAGNQLRRGSVMEGEANGGARYRHIHRYGVRCGRSVDSCSPTTSTTNVNVPIDLSSRRTPLQRCMTQVYDGLIGSTAMEESPTVVEPEAIGRLTITGTALSHRSRAAMASLANVISMHQ